MKSNLKSYLKSQYLKPAIITTLLLVIYSPTIWWMIDRWNAKDSYYSHGPLVPLVSLYVLWMKRDRLSKIKAKPAALGLWLLIIGLIIHMLSAFFRVYFTSAFSSLLVISGILLYFFGTKVFMESLFSILFLIFMIPLPLIAIVGITFKMKIFAAYCANKIINAMGIPALLDGSIIRMRHTYVIVEDVCSGLRSLISLLALGTIIAYLSKLSRPKKIVVFFAAGVMAIIGNIARIIFMALTSEIYGAKFTEGFLHTLSGLIVFIVALAGLMIVVKELE